MEAAALRETLEGPPEPEKLEKIFREHQAQVFRAAYRVTGSATDAEDVLQTVFLRLLRLERGDALSGSPGSYLHRAAVNAALDLVRNRRTWKTTPIDEVTHLAEDPSPGTSDAFTRAFRGQWSSADPRHRGKPPHDSSRATFPWAGPTVPPIARFRR